MLYVDFVILGYDYRTNFEMLDSAKEVAMIGDSLVSDIVGAKNAGLKTIMVKTGNFSEKELNESKIKPDYLIYSIKELSGLV